MSLLPKEHGAYGQVTFPIVTAFVVAGPSMAGLLVATTVIAGFLAHEPAAVLLGVRGPRAWRERRSDAVRWLCVCLVVGAAAGSGALLAMSSDARWSIAVPLAPAALLGATLVGGREKAWYGEVAASLAFAAAAVPVSIAGSASAATAAAIAIPFALLFITSTLAVRVVILHVRRGGDSRAAALTRGATLSVAGAGAIVLAVLSMTNVLSASVLGAATPGLLTAAVVGVHPPAPTHLRRLGWTLIAVSLVTAAIVIATA
jgi:hypothetical protein